jgi:hypothetical protein
VPIRVVFGESVELKVFSALKESVWAYCFRCFLDRGRSCGISPDTTKHNNKQVLHIRESHRVSLTGVPSDCFQHRKQTNHQTTDTAHTHEHMLRCQHCTGLVRRIRRRVHRTESFSSLAVRIQRSYCCSASAVTSAPAPAAAAVHDLWSEKPSYLFSGSSSRGRSHFYHHSSYDAGVVAAAGAAATLLSGAGWYSACEEREQQQRDRRPVQIRPSIIQATSSSAMLPTPAAESAEEEDEYGGEGSSSKSAILLGTSAPARNVMLHRMRSLRARSLTDKYMVDWKKVLGEGACIVRLRRRRRRETPFCGCP